MSAETKRILEMLAEGKISAGDAEKLLDKLNASSNDASLKEKAADAGAAPKQPREVQRVAPSERSGRDQARLCWVPPALLQASLEAVPPPVVRNPKKRAGAWLLTCN